MSLPAYSTAIPFPTPCAATAEQLRLHLMSAAPACRTTRAAAPHGLVDVRASAPGVFVLPAPSWSDPELRFMVRPEVAERLSRAAAVLPADLRLGFWEGLRPIPVQQALWKTGLDYLETSFPGRSRRELEAVLERLVAHPEAAPPHSTGSAVDVAPVDAFGRVLSPADAWGRLATEIMSRGLRKAGLASYDPEWWHWSYGDEEWARANDCAPLAFAAASEFDGPGGGI